MEGQLKAKDGIMLQTFPNQWAPGGGSVLTAIPTPLLSDRGVRNSVNGSQSWSHIRVTWTILLKKTGLDL